MSNINDPISVREIFSMPNLSIPKYQRPYKWQKKNVASLIADVEHEISLKDSRPSDYRYRIGSIIIHQEKDGDIEISNIVDGQQRILTISLLLHALECKVKNELLTLEFDNRDTLDNLRHNYDFILSYFSSVAQEKKDSFCNYLLDNCEVILIEASNLAEAFQMFDSQNARGKSLEPADLLKAYHLRAMLDEDEKRMCVDRWEYAIDQGLLHHVLSKIIYRTRCWMKRQYNCHYFTNDTIEEFKGIDINIFNRDSHIYPYMEGLYIQSQINCFRIDEPIVNGRRFFDYINHYISLYSKLFPRLKDFSTAVNEEDNEFQKLIRNNCFYTNMHRKGDSRIRNVLYCQLLAFFDKFGNAKEYFDFFDIAYRFDYHLRITNPLVGYGSIHNTLLVSPNPFEWIKLTYLPETSSLR